MLVCLVFASPSFWFLVLMLVLVLVCVVLRLLAADPAASERAAVQAPAG